MFLGAVSIGVEVQRDTDEGTPSNLETVRESDYRPVSVISDVKCTIIIC